MNANEIIATTVSQVKDTESDLREAKKLIDFLRKTGYSGTAELEANYNKIIAQKQRFLAEAKNFN